MNNSHTALIIIDVPEGLDSPGLGQRNKPEAESNMALILNHWRERSLPVMHVKHNSTVPGSTLRPELPGNRIKEIVKPLSTEKLFQKTVNSAFTGTTLEAYLHEGGLTHLVVVGLTTDHCVSTSVRAAANLGFKVTLVEDATAAFERTGYEGKYFTADQMHEVNLASLHGEFCTVVKTEQVLTGSL